MCVCVCTGLTSGSLQMLLESILCLPCNRRSGPPGAVYSAVRVPGPRPPLTSLVWHAAAVQVSGATGSNSAHNNGVYRPVAREVGKPVYKKDGAGTWIEYWNNGRSAAPRGPAPRTSTRRTDRRSLSPPQALSLSHACVRDRVGGGGGDGPGST